MAKTNQLHTSVMSKEQLEAVKASAATRIYVDSNLFLAGDKRDFEGTHAELIVALPYITRKEKWDGCEEVKRVTAQLKDKGFSGVLARNLEQLGLLREMNFDGRVIADYSVYVWNDKALEFLLGSSKDSFGIDEITVPYELTFREAADMVRASKTVADIPVSFNIYGYVPMMISAGCVKKTTGGCSGRMNELYSEQISITDRLSNVLPVTCNCRSCYNVIWNVHPTSLHKKLSEITTAGLFNNLRVDFTVENKDRTWKVLKYYTDLLNNDQAAEIFENGSYTAGHYSREAE